MTGKEVFRRIKPDCTEQVEVDVFAVYQSDEEDDNCMFEEQIQALEAESYVGNHAVVKEEESGEEHSLIEDSARLASDSFTYRKTLKSLNVLQDCT